MFRKTLLLGVMLAPFAVCAEGLSYNYGEVSYLDTDYDTAGDGDGFTIGGSFAINEMFFATGSYTDGELENGTKVDLQDLSVGVGYRTNEYTGAFDLLGTVSFESLELGASENSGFGLGVGLRGELSPGFEVNGGFKYKDIDKVDGFDYGIGGVYTFTPNWAVVGSYSRGDLEDDRNVKLESDNFRIGGRYMF